MTINVSYLTTEQIERKALSLVHDYFDSIHEPIQTPIPVEDILENHLKLTLDFDNLNSMLGLPDVLGATWVENGAVYIDESLDPEEHPNMEGRYNFTLGHEVGHWILHRDQISRQGVPTVMFRQHGLIPLLICLMRQRKERIEWQADQFSSALLMPKKLVMAAWEARLPHSNGRPYIYNPLHWRDRTYRLERPRTRLIGSIIGDALQTRPKAAQSVFRDVAKEFAQQFRVSTQAMQIRLESLGLLRFPEGNQDFRSG